MKHVARRAREARWKNQLSRLVMLALCVWGLARELDAQPRRRQVARRRYTAADSARAPTKSKAFLAADSADSRRREVVIRRMRAVGTYLGQLPWDIPEYHDEQPFPLTSGAGYGPMAYVLASPYLEGFKNIKQIDAHGPYGMFAAIVYVDAPVGTALPAPYSDLHLAPQLNCVFLAHTGPNPKTGWSAFILPGSDVTGCPRPDATTAPAASLAAAFSQHQANPPHEDYPGVARFDEDNADHPLIGVRCINAWCEIGPPGFVQRPPSHHAIPFLMRQREGKVKAWHDDQLLAVRNPATGKLEPRLRATVTPSPGLADLGLDDFKDMWVRVATIWVATDPSGTKYGAAPTPGAHVWGMRQGLNILELAYVKGQWQAQVTPGSANGDLDAGASPTALIITQHKHYDIVVPGTARFRWRDTDEGVWVYCDQGCCRVDSDQ